MKIFIIPVLVLLLSSCSPTQQSQSSFIDLPPYGNNGECYAKANMPDDDGTSKLDWIQVVCPSDRSFKIMNTINNGLKEKGYEVGKVKNITHNNVTSYFIDEMSMKAFFKFQKDNNLPSGRFDVKTLKTFQINFKNDIWVIN